MLKAEFIQNLKQVNISKDRNATKARIKDAWQPLSKSVREEILALSGLKKSTVERAYTKGTATARVVMAMAQVLNINPYYLTGEADEQGTFTNHAAKELLNSLGYDTSKGAFARGKRITEPVTAPQAVEPHASDQTDFSTVLNDCCKLITEEMQSKAGSLSQDDLAALIHSLIIQAAYSNSKKKILDLIKCLLLV
jgi:hypothetical protein